MKIIKHYWEKLGKINGEIYHVHGLEDNTKISVLLNQCTDNCNQNFNKDFFKIKANNLIQKSSWNFKGDKFF